MARKLATRRLSDFQDYVAGQLAAGHRFIDDLVDEPVGDPEELARAAAG